MLFEPVVMVAAVSSDCSIEVMARIEVWSMETMTGEITFGRRLLIEAMMTVTVVVILVDVRKSNP